MFLAQQLNNTKYVEIKKITRWIYSEPLTEFGHDHLDPKGNPKPMSAFAY